MKSFLKWSAIGIFAVVFAGCASGPELEKYPRREIDRPFTLPKGVATWHIPTVLGYVKDDSDSVFVPPIPIPLIWEQSLSDDWNLLWAPIPLGVSHQFANTDQVRTGFSVLTGMSYGSSSGFRLRPTFGFSYRHKCSRDFALDVTPAATFDIPFKSGQPFYWSAGLSIGPLFQLSDTFSLKPNASAGVARGQVRSIADSEDTHFSEETTFGLGLGLDSVWSIGRQWDFRPSYSFAGIGSSTGLRAHIGVLEFVHFW